MSVLLEILDVVVLLLLVVQIVRTVWDAPPQGSGSSVLSICLLLALLVAATVSFTAYLGLVEVSSSLMRVILLVVLLAMAGFLRVASVSSSAA